MKKQSELFTLGEAIWRIALVMLLPCILAAILIGCEHVYPLCNSCGIVHRDNLYRLPKSYNGAPCPTCGLGILSSPPIKSDAWEKNKASFETQ